MNPADPQGKAYGGFSLGGLLLALPMESLREVVPCGGLMPLPCKAACVIGGIDLRGVVVPVVDLRIVLGRELATQTFPSVIIMVHDGRVLGLLADGVTGVFSDVAGALKRVGVTGPLEPVFCGCLQRADDGSLVSVLSPQALASLPEVPMVQDPEPGRQLVQTDAADEAQAGDESRQLMLIRCGRVALAIDALAVQATLSNPQVRPSVTARGHCCGVIDYAGSSVPVVDLLALSGLGATDRNNRLQAFVIRLDAGMVAFLIDAVIDVVRTRPRDVIALPACAVPQPSLFAGALPVGNLSAEVREQPGLGASAYLVLDHAGLSAHDEVAALAGTNTPVDGATAVAAAAACQGAPKRNVLTYPLAGETATPLEQVMEILPYSADLAVFDSPLPMLGVVVHRGRSIPLMCLSRLLSGRPAEITPAASVLVVEADGDLVGFVVPGLTAIEPAEWEPALPGPGGASRRLVLVGEGAGERMLPLHDLQQMARSIQARAMPTQF